MLSIPDPSVAQYTINTSAAGVDPNGYKKFGKIIASFSPYYGASAAYRALDPVYETFDARVCKLKFPTLGPYTYDPANTQLVYTTPVSDPPLPSDYHTSAVVPYSCNKS